MFKRLFALVTTTAVAFGLASSPAKSQDERTFRELPGRSICQIAQVFLYEMVVGNLTAWWPGS